MRLIGPAIAALAISALLALGHASAEEASRTPDADKLREMFGFQEMLREMEVLENMDLLLDYETLSEDIYDDEKVSDNNSGGYGAGRHHGSPGGY